MLSLRDGGGGLCNGGGEVVGGTNLQDEQMDFGMRPGFSWGSVHSNITVRYPNGSVE